MVWARSGWQSRTRRAKQIEARICLRGLCLLVAMRGIMVFLLRVCEEAHRRNHAKPRASELLRHRFLSSCCAGFQKNSVGGSGGVYVRDHPMSWAQGMVFGSTVWARSGDYLLESGWTHSCARLKRRLRSRVLRVRVAARSNSARASFWRF